MDGVRHLHDGREGGGREGHRAHEDCGVLHGEGVDQIVGLIDVCWVESRSQGKTSSLIYVLQGERKHAKKSSNVTWSRNELNLLLLRNVIERQTLNRYKAEASCLRWPNSLASWNADVLMRDLHSVHTDCFSTQVIPDAGEQG